MSNLARVGDIATGVCKCHKKPIQVVGVITSGSVKASNKGQAIARIGDTVIFSCGHSGIIVSGSSQIFCDGKGVARVGDSIVGCVTGVISKGSDSITSA